MRSRLALTAPYTLLLLSQGEAYASHPDREAVIWEHGRRFCFQPFGNDTNMRWTYDDLAITASAINDDGDWAALEAFFVSAGPIAP